MQTRAVAFCLSICLVSAVLLISAIVSPKADAQLRLQSAALQADRPHRPWEIEDGQPLQTFQDPQEDVEKNATGDLPPKQPWMEDAQKRIDRLRKVDVRFVVLDAQGRLCPDAKLVLKQESHAFTIAASWPFLPEQPATQTTGKTDHPGSESPDHVALDGRLTDRPLLRVFNTAWLQTGVSWQAMVEQPGQWRQPAVDQVLADMQSAKSQGLNVHLGAWLRGDPSQNPEALYGMDAGERLDAGLKDWTAWLRQAKPFVDGLTLVDDRQGRDAWVHQTGMAGLRAMLAVCRVELPNVTVGIGYRNSMKGRQAAAMQESVLAMQQAFVRPDRLALDQQVDGMVLAPVLLRDTDELVRLRTPVQWMNLEATGPSEAWAASNLQTALYVAFSNPAFEGVFFTGPTAERSLNPQAALIQPDGQPALLGRVVDHLFHDVWWDESESVADFQGRVDTRLFVGTHWAEVHLPDGTLFRQPVRVWHKHAGGPAKAEMVDGQQWVILQPASAAKRP